MPFLPPSFGVVLLPVTSPGRESLARRVREAGLRPLEAVEGAELALVDLTQPEGEEALASLPGSAGLGRTRESLSTLAIVPDGTGALERLELLRVSDVVSRANLDAELPFRLRRLAERHAARAEERQRQKDAALLLELTADYAASLDVEALLHDVTRRLATEMDIARASLVLLDGPGRGRIVAASDDPALKDLVIDLARYPELREVARTGKPVLIEDAPSHPLLEGLHPALAARGIHAIAALPLPVRGEVLGALLVRAAGNRQGFSPREMSFLTTVAHATAVALRNAALMESSRERTEREKRARLQAEARASELARYEGFFEHVSEGVAILDAEGRVLSLNPFGRRILDVDVKDTSGARGQLLLQLAQANDDGPLAELLHASVAGEVRTDVEVLARTGAGRWVILSVSGAPLPLSGAAVILSFRDVTLARQLEAELRHTKDFLERLIDSSVDAIIAADMQGHIILFNKGAEAICGYTAAEARASLDVRTLYAPGVAREVMLALRSDEHGGRGRLNVCRQTIISKAGERVPVNMTASILYEGDRETATVGIFTDLRDRMQLERKLSDVETRLEESEKNAVIVALAGTAAHELNQPLTSILGYAELLKRRLKEGEFAWRPVDIIYREAERMAEIVRKIGKITRYETKAYVGSAQILDLDKASSNEE